MNIEIYQTSCKTDVTRNSYRMPKRIQRNSNSINVNDMTNNSFPPRRMGFAKNDKKLTTQPWGCGVTKTQRFSFESIVGWVLCGSNSGPLDFLGDYESVLT